MVRSVDQAEGEQGDECLADGADGEGTPALAAEFAKVGSETDAGKGVSKLEGWAGIEPANTGFADPRVSHFATSPFVITQQFLTLRLPPEHSGQK